MTPLQNGINRPAHPCDEQHESKGDRPLERGETQKSLGKPVGDSQFHFSRESDGKQTEKRDLHADDGGNGKIKQAVDIESEYPGNVPRLDGYQYGTQQPKRGQHETRSQKQPLRAAQQHEPQMPPPVPPRSKMRRALPAIRTQRGRYLRNAEFG